MRRSGCRDEEKEFITTNLGQLAAISIINEIKENPFYGSLSFVVQVSQWFGHILEVMGAGKGLEDRNCWLVISYDRVQLCSISVRDGLFEFSYEDVVRVVAYPAAVEVILRGREVEAVRLKSTNSYSIR